MSVCRLDKPGAYVGSAGPGPLVALRSVTGVALIAATVLASGVTSIDANVVKVAMPAIGRSLGASVSALQWTLTSYLLAVATLLLLAGSPGRSVRAAARAGDRAGIMTTASAVPAIQREPGLPGQPVVVIGGSAGIGLETARRARAEGADVVLTGRNPERLQHAAQEVGALSTAAFDATDPAALDRFFRDLPGAIDHVLVTGPGPYYARLADLDRERAHRDFDEHL